METDIVYRIGMSSRSYPVRNLIAKFALQMECEMLEKDELGYTHEDKNIDILIEKLEEERREVMFELLQEPINEQALDKELCHEAIMAMLIWNKYNK